MDAQLHHPVPPAPEFGEPCPIGPAPAVLDFLAARRSATPQQLTAPGPTPRELEDLLRLGARVPDHGKLFPWRFILLEGAPKARFVEQLHGMAARQPNPGKAEAVLAKIAPAPLTIAVISRATSPVKPVWEQELSAAAVCMTLLIAAQAMGYGANWITDWYAYDDEARALLGVAPEEKVAGFLHIGTSPEAPLERVRPEVAAITTRWGSAD